MSSSAEAPTPFVVSQTKRVFLCGDVMIGRGIDQILPQPCDPLLFESYATSALDYVRLAEAANGPIQRQVDHSYIWGAALDELKRAQPDIRLINLETAITRHPDYDPKGINYRVSPENAACLSIFAPDCCALANNHVLDWGHEGLRDTLATLERLHIRHAGAGRNADEAHAPAIIEIPGKGRTLIYAMASVTSGVPRNWAATDERLGVRLLTNLSESAAEHIAIEITRIRQPGDVVIVSVHWGANWGYDVPDEHRRFAHALIDRAGVSIVYGHSSHHAKAIEMYRDRLILYGCGDFLNDYEGIHGYEEFRGDLTLMYFMDIVCSDGRVAALEIAPLQICKFRLELPSSEDCMWLQQTLDRQCQPFGTRITLTSEKRLVLSWSTSETPGKSNISDHRHR